MLSIVQLFYLIKTRIIYTIFLAIIEHSVLMALVCY